MLRCHWLAFRLFGCCHRHCYRHRVIFVILWRLHLAQNRSMPGACRARTAREIERKEERERQYNSIMYSNKFSTIFCQIESLEIYNSSVSFTLSFVDGVLCRVHRVSFLLFIFSNSIFALLFCSFDLFFFVPFFHFFFSWL